MAASTNVAKTKAASAQGAAKPQETAQVPGISRREFLYYSWGASIALLLAQSAGLLIWYGLPRFREGEFGGVFNVTSIPAVGDSPVDYPAGKFWLSNTEQGVLAIYKVCTHLGCLYKWVEANGRFECPCHGSKFETTGLFIEGPAPRSLDRFAITVITDSGEFPSNATGDPVQVTGNITSIRVDTGARIQRAGKV